MSLQASAARQSLELKGLQMSWLPPRAISGAPLPPLPPRPPPVPHPHLNGHDSSSAWPQQPQSETDTVLLHDVQWKGSFTGGAAVATPKSPAPAPRQYVLQPPPPSEERLETALSVELPVPIIKRWHCKLDVHWVPPRARPRANGRQNDALPPGSDGQESDELPTDGGPLANVDVELKASPLLLHVEMRALQLMSALCEASSEYCMFLDTRRTRPQACVWGRRVCWLANSNLLLAPRVLTSLGALRTYSVAPWNLQVSPVRLWLSQDGG